MPNPKPPYPPEFRAEAVRLARQPGNTVRRVARDLGVSNETLRGWVKQTQVDRHEPSGLTTDERDELSRLRRRVRTRDRRPRPTLRRHGPAADGRAMCSCG